MQQKVVLTNYQQEINLYKAEICINNKNQRFFFNFQMITLLNDYGTNPFLGEKFAGLF